MGKSEESQIPAAAESFADLYDQNSVAILRYFYRRTGCPQTAADLTSETFASAPGSYHRFRFIGKPRAAWLQGIARNHLRHYHRDNSVRLRARRRLSMEPATFADDELLYVEQKVDLERLQVALARLVDELPSKLRVAVVLRIIDERSYQQIAADLGCSEGAARVRVSRGLTTLAALAQPERDELL